MMFNDLIDLNQSALKGFVCNVNCENHEFECRHLLKHQVLASLYIVFPLTRNWELTVFGQQMRLPLLQYSIDLQFVR